MTELSLSEKLAAMKAVREGENTQKVANADKKPSDLVDAAVGNTTTNSEGKLPKTSQELQAEVELANARKEAEAQQRAEAQRTQMVEVQRREQEAAVKQSQTIQQRTAQVSAHEKAAVLATPQHVATRVFYGEFPPAQTYLTPKGKAVSFYQGYCVSDDPEIIKYCQQLADVQDVTSKVNPEQVPTPPVRSRQRNWAAGQADPTTVNPLELLQRAARVQTTSDLGGNSAASNSVV